MPVELFLNELSVPNDELELNRACELFKCFVGAVRTAMKFKNGAFLNADISINDISIGSKFNVARLRNLNSCVEEGLLLKTLQSRSPYSRIADDLGLPIGQPFEYRVTANGPWVGAIANGLGFAHLYSGLGLSFSLDEFWKQSLIALEQQVLDDVTNEIISTEVTVQNCYSAEQTQEFEIEFGEERTGAQDGQELWDRRQELLPHLRFIPRVRAQLLDFQHGDRSFRSAYARLVEINDAVGEWRNSGAEHPSWPCRISPESEIRINMGLVDFQNDEGKSLTFSDHARFSPIEGRIHFRIEVEPHRHAIIGHVGRKLGIG